MALMLDALPKISKPGNSPFIGFEQKTKERQKLEKAISDLRDMSLPLWINGPVQSPLTKNCIVPHNFGRTLGSYCLASEENVHQAIKTILVAREKWSQVPWPIKVDIFRKAARLIETKYMFELVAAVKETQPKYTFYSYYSYP